MPTRLATTALPLFLLPALLLACDSDRRRSSPVPNVEQDAATEDGGSDGGTDSGTADAASKDADTDDGGEAGDAGVDGAIADAGTTDASKPEVTYPAPCTRDLDLNSDGVIDQRVTYTYDDSGRVTVVDLDDSSSTGTQAGADGTADRSDRTHFDGMGNVIQTEADWDGDGNIDLNTSYDATGNKLSEAWDVLDDGSKVDLTTWAYDGKARLRTIERDADGDGNIDAVSTYIYGAGDMLQRLEVDQDINDAVIDDVRTYEYDADGNMTVEERIVGGGSLVAERHTWAHNAMGQPLSHSYDEDADGSADRIDTWMYDADGKLQSEEIDRDASGSADERRTFDTRGNVLTSEEFEDGLLEYREVYTFDDSDRLLTYQEYDDTGSAISGTTYSYGSDGALLSISYDSNGNGQTNSRREYGYRMDGQPLFVEVDVRADGTEVLRLETYTYDAAGNLLSVTNDSDADGVVDDLVSYGYGCWS